VTQASREFRSARPCCRGSGGFFYGRQLTIRDLVRGAELAASIKDRPDYLELRANAQFTVPEGPALESVKEVLVGHI